MTPVRNRPQLQAKLPRRRIKAPRLIPQFPRKHQHPFHFHHFFANDYGLNIQAPPFLECGGLAAAFTAETTPTKQQSSPIFAQLAFSAPSALSFFLFFSLPVAI
jgi:hypothetical protein